MRSIAIPGVPVPLSVIGMGLGTADLTNPDAVFAVLTEYTDAGGTVIDTAHSYGGGAADRLLGEWLADRDRSTVVVVGKGCHPAADGLPRVSPGAIEADLTESLERIGTDVLDLYLLHRDDESVPVAPIVDALNDQHARGRIRAFGGSNWSVARIEAANAYAAANGLVPFVASSPGMSLATVNEPMWPDCIYADAQTCADHERLQLPMLAWSTQARGFFSGKYSRDEPGGADMVRVYANEVNFARLARAQELAQAKSTTANEIALAYVLHQPFPVVALIAARTSAQLRDSLAAESLELSADEVRWLADGAP